MPNDAKLGLAVGVGLVIAFAVVFYRTEATGQSGDPAATIVQPENTDPQPPPRSRKRTPTTSTAWATTSAPAQVASRRHTVREGDTFQTLARQYYGAEEKDAVLAAANREAVNAEGTLTPGMTVVIPETEDERP